MADIEKLPVLPGGLITISLAAEMLGLSRQGTHKMARTGRLRAWQLESTGDEWPVVVLKEEVQEMAKKRQGVVEVLKPETAEDNAGEPAASPG
jgi:hypothetical protein